MPLDPVKVAAVVAGGLSVVCSTCENYWRARDLNVPDGRCLAKDGCGSPIAGDVFHEYVGPITQFDRFCFVCGDTSTHALRVGGLVRVIGCCARHVELVQTLRPEGRNEVKVVIVSKEGEASSEEKPKEKKRLILKTSG